MKCLSVSLGLVVLCSILTFSPSMVVASPGGNSAYFRIEQVTTGDGGSLWLKPEPGHTVHNPASCTNATQYGVWANLPDPTAGAGHKERVSLLMGAFLNNKKLYVSVDNGYCLSSYPVVLGVFVTNLP